MKISEKALWPCVIFFALAAYIFVFPTVDWAPDLSWHDGQRIGQIGLLVLTSAGVLAGDRLAGHVFGIWRLIPGLARFALALAFALGLVSSSAAPLPRWALLEWSLLLLLVLLALAVGGIRREWGPRFDRGMLWVLVLTATAYLLNVCVAYSAALIEHLDLEVSFLFSGFSNPRFFGHFQSMTLPLLVLPAMVWARTPITRAGFALLPMLWWMLAIAAGTRGTWLGMMVAGAVIVACCRHQGATWLKWQLLSFLGGLAAYGLFFFLLPWLVKLPTQLINRLPEIGSYLTREILWSQSLAFIAAHPWLGIGPMHFAYYPNDIAAHPHNSLLQWAAEWGAPSALLVLGLMAYGGVVYVRGLRAMNANDDRESCALRVALLGSMTAAAAQSLVDGVIVMPFSQTLLAVICGWALGLHATGTPVSAKVGRGGRWAMAAVVLFAVGALAHGVYPEIRDIPGRERAFQDKHPGRLLPRFWQQGWIYE